MTKLIDNKRLIGWLACVLLSFGYSYAQETHWDCNIADYEFDMTMYLDLKIDGQIVTGDGYEVAAFCGDECRGVASVEIVDGVEDAKYYYLRVRSNQTNGEYFVLKIYEKSTEAEFTIAETLEFVPNGLVGYPSTPKVIEHKNTYNIVFVVDGEVLSKQSLLWGSNITSPEEPTKEGYTFSGWSEVPATMPAKDVTVSGTFTINKYLVTFKIGDDVIAADSLEYGAAIVAPEAPVKEGYTFDGWGDVAETVPASDLTYEGSYTVNSYLLTYTVDGEVVEADSVVYGTAITAIAEPVKEGYTFSGWSEVPATMPAKDVTVSGSFTINKYLVTFKIGDETIAAYSLEYGAAIVAPDAPVKEGHTFDGWGDVAETVPASDLTYEGSYTINSYLLTYMVDGEVVEADSVVYGTAITAIAEPVKEGYTFSGWSEVPATMPAKDVTVSGSFTINKYLVTFKIGDETIAAYSLEYGAAIVAPDAPVKEGHTFDGWGDVAETVPASDLTYEGSYTINSYLLTYMVDGEVIEAVSVAYGTAITAIAEPVKEGYTFSGWSEVPATMPAKDVTVSGSFTINQYTISFLIDGEIFATDTITYGEKIILPDVPVKEGYIFAWNDEIPETMPAEDIVINGSYTTTNIENIENQEDVRNIYTIDGKRTNEPRKGINIVRLKDGSIRKVLIK